MSSSAVLHASRASIPQQVEQRRESRSQTRPGILLFAILALSSLGSALAATSKKVLRQGSSEWETPEDVAYLAQQHKTACLRAFRIADESSPPSGLDGTYINLDSFGSKGSNKRELVIEELIRRGIERGIVPCQEYQKKAAMVRFLSNN